MRLSCHLPLQQSICEAPSPRGDSEGTARRGRGGIVSVRVCSGSADAARVRHKCTSQCGREGRRDSKVLRSYQHVQANISYNYAKPPGHVSSRPKSSEKLALLTRRKCFLGGRPLQEIPHISAAAAECHHPRRSPQPAGAEAHVSQAGRGALPSAHLLSRHLERTAR